MAQRRDGTTNAVEILRKRYVRDNAKRAHQVEHERLCAEIATTIYALRTAKGLSQRQLAQLIGTTQSVISRLEDSDYDGHSLQMLERIAGALDRRVVVLVQELSVRESPAHYAFRQLVQSARRDKGLSISEISKKLGLRVNDIERLEGDWSYRPSLRTVSKLSKFLGVSEERLATLAGETGEVPRDLRDMVSKFTRQSRAPIKLSPSERKALHEFRSFLAQS